MNFKMREGYPLISKYARSDRRTYEKMRDNMPDRIKAQKALNEFAENSLFKNCFPNNGYIKGLGLQAE